MIVMGIYSVIASRHLVAANYSIFGGGWHSKAFLTLTRGKEESATSFVRVLLFRFVTMYVAGRKGLACR